MTPGCPNVLIFHRVWAPTQPGVDRSRVDVFECLDPDCDARPADHQSLLPCRWSWPYAHGKVGTGKVFPLRRCGACHHIARKGESSTKVDVGDARSFLSNG